MKNLDLVSKRIFVSAISVSMILLCASLFVFSLNTISQAKANPGLPFSKPTDDRLTKVDIWPFGIVSGKAYWIEFNEGGWVFRNSEVSTWKSVD